MRFPAGFGSVFEGLCMKDGVREEDVQEKVVNCLSVRYHTALKYSCSCSDGGCRSLAVLFVYVTY